MGGGEGGSPHTSSIFPCRLEDCGLTGACCGDLATVLTSSRTLILLNLIDNRLGHHGVVLLCEGLRHPDCNLHLLG